MRLNAFEWQGKNNNNCVLMSEDNSHAVPLNWREPGQLCSVRLTRVSGNLPPARSKSFPAINLLRILIIQPRQNLSFQDRNTAMGGGAGRGGETCGYEDSVDTRGRKWNQSPTPSTRYAETSEEKQVKQTSQDSVRRLCECFTTYRLRGLESFCFSAP